MVLKRKSYNFKIAGFIISLILSHLVSLNAQLSLPPELWQNDADYTFMYYPEPLRQTTEFHIQTNRHFFAFDYSTLSLKGLTILSDALPEQEAVKNDLDFLPPDAGEPNLLSCGINVNGSSYKLNQGPLEPKYCRLIESGKFYQHREIIDLKFENGAPEINSSLELSSWPDRIDIQLKLDPQISLNSGSAELDFTIPGSYNNIIEEGGMILATDAEGNGFLFFSDVGVALNDQVCKLSVHFDGSGQYSLQLTILSVKDYQGQAPALLKEQEDNIMNLTCRQTAPADVALSENFDRKLGAYQILLRNDNKSKDRIERVSTEISNSSDSSQIVRLVYTKPSAVYDITGVSAMIRDHEGNPTGIPVQISKNWHNQSPESEYNGPWLRCYTIMTIPAQTTVNFEFTLVNAYWGTLPAASHNQLSLVGWNGGWGDNQLWEESAIGAFGETACYEPDGGQAQTMVCDIRPLMIESTDPDVNRPVKWSWSPNVGGADFFRFYDESGEKQFITRLKTSHKRNCPNLTEVIYSGVTENYEADYSLNTGIYRTDDYVRIVYKLKLKVNEPLNFSRLAIAQIGAESYSYTGERKFAFGDENGLIEEWDTKWGGSVYRKKGLTTDGQFPWISMHQAVNRYPDQWGAWANRGVIVREWNAVIGGNPSGPHFSEYGAIARGAETSLVEINPPDGTSQLLPGDYIEAEIVEIIIPKEAESYYGPNELFRNMLEKNEDSWKMVYREVKGNDIEITAEKGTILDNFPVLVQVNAANEASLDIKGGIGYVPVTFTGITDYKNFNLRMRKDGIEISPEEQEVYGNDYWQTDYDPVTKTWDITYSIPCDSIVQPDYGQAMVLYNDFHSKQSIPWKEPENLFFTDSVDNPAPSLVHPGLKVAKAERGVGVWSNVHFQFPDYIDLSTHNRFKVMVYFEGNETVPEDCEFRFILRNNGEGSTQYSLIKPITTANKWQELIFECPGANQRDNYNQLWFFFSSPDNTGDNAGQIFYIDEVMGPPLTMNLNDLDIYTTTSGDSIVMDFKNFPDNLKNVQDPAFLLSKNGNPGMRIDNFSYDSSFIYLILDDIGISGKDDISLTFSSGEIRDEKERILPWFDKVEIVNNIPVNSWNVSFSFFNAESLSPLSDVAVGADTMMGYSDNEGTLVLELPPESYLFTVEKEYFFPVDTLLEVNSDTEVLINLKPTIADVQFKVKHNLQPVYDAEIIVSDKVKNTNTVGIAVFDSLHIYENYIYQVNKEGYEQITDTFILTKDTIIIAELGLQTERNSMSGSNPKLYPLPANSYMIIESEVPIESYLIIDLSGRIRKKQKFYGRQINIDLSDIEAGNYIIVLHSRSSKIIQKEFTIIR